LDQENSAVKELVTTPNWYGKIQLTLVADGASFNTEDFLVILKIS